MTKYGHDASFVTVFPNLTDTDVFQFWSCVLLLKRTGILTAVFLNPHLSSSHITSLIIFPHLWRSESPEIRKHNLAASLYRPCSVAYTECNLFFVTVLMNWRKHKGYMLSILHLKRRNWYVTSWLAAASSSSSADSSKETPVAPLPRRNQNSGSNVHPRHIELCWIH